MAELLIALPTSMGGLEDTVSEIFGRAAKFTLVTVKDGKIDKTEIIDNPASNSTGGAGIAATQELVERGVNAVIAVNLGFNAFEVLRKANIEVYNGANLKVSEAVEKFLKEELSKISSPNKRKGKFKPFSKR
jgi:predicted Fe-Mo cluster-binding NifX family protein